MTIGIGLHRRGEIPRRELGPALGPFPRALRTARVGIGLSRRLVTPSALGERARRFAPAPSAPPGLQRAKMPTDRPIVRVGPRTREEAAIESAQSDVEIAGTEAGPPVDLGELLRFVGKGIEQIGAILRNPAALLVGRAVQQVAPPPAPPPPEPTLEMPAEIRSALELQRAGEREAAAGEVVSLKASEGFANLETGTGAVKTVRGMETFTFEVITLDGS